MMYWVKVIVAMVAVLGAVSIAATWIGATHWAAGTARLKDRLVEAIADRGTSVLSYHDLKGLPDPVARYFRTVLMEGQRPVRSARIKHTGELRIGETETGWKAFESTQYFSVRPPGFIWAARIRMAPLMPVYVRDAYIGGRGSKQGKMFGLVSVVDARDSRALDEGALQRYLAEAVWFPVALLPGAGVTWSAIDAHRARASLSDAGTSVSMEFGFNTQGEITSFYTPARHRAVGGGYEHTPWTGVLGEYREYAGVRIPTKGEVAWVLSGRPFPVWKGRIVDVEYDFAQAH